MQLEREEGREDNVGMIERKNEAAVDRWMERKRDNEREDGNGKGGTGR